MRYHAAQPRRTENAAQRRQADGGASRLQGYHVPGPDAPRREHARDGGRPLHQASACEVLTSGGHQTTGVAYRPVVTRSRAATVDGEGATARRR
jgi:hypothetical protein